MLLMEHIIIIGPSLLLVAKRRVISFLALRILSSGSSSLGNHDSATIAYCRIANYQRRLRNFSDK